MYHSPLESLFMASHCLVVVQLLSRVQLFVTPWTAAHQASLSFTISLNLLRLMSTESVMPSNHLILCYPLLLLPSIFPRIRVFSNESLFASGGQSIGTTGAGAGESHPSSMKPCKVFCDQQNQFSQLHLSSSWTSYPDNTKCSQAHPFIPTPLFLQV